MKIFDYIKDSKGEIKHVSWPTKAQATAYTILVIVLSIVLAVYLGVFDWILTFGLEETIGKQGSSFDPADHIMDDELDAMIEDVSGASSTLEFTPNETTN